MAKKLTKKMVDEAVMQRIGLEKSAELLPDPARGSVALQAMLNRGKERQLGGNRLGS